MPQLEITIFDMKCLAERLHSGRMSYADVFCAQVKGSSTNAMKLVEWISWSPCNYSQALKPHLPRPWHVSVALLAARLGTLRAPQETLAQALPWEQGLDHCQSHESHGFAAAESSV